MFLLDRIAETRIAAAQQRGEFDGLPGAGKRLVFDDDAFVPPELRAAYRALKNAGYVPPEVECRRQIADLEALLRSVAVEGSAQHRQGIRRVNHLRARLESCGKPLRLDAAYAFEVYRRLVRE